MVAVAATVTSDVGWRQGAAGWVGGGAAVWVVEEPAPQDRTQLFIKRLSVDPVCRLRLIKKQNKNNTKLFIYLSLVEFFFFSDKLQ